MLLFGVRNIVFPLPASAEGMTMPTYKYFCDNCRHRFKRVESISAHEQHRKPACPKCRSKRVSRVFSGFYAKTGKKS